MELAFESTLAGKPGSRRVIRDRLGRIVEDVESIRAPQEGQRLTLSIPVLGLARIGFYLQNVARAATDSFATHSAALTALGRVAAGLLTAVSWVFLAALHASDALANVVGHNSEFEADRRAVRMGYGRQLVEALRAVIRQGGGGRAIGWRARLASTHPPARTRVARIEAMMVHPSRK